MARPKLKTETTTLKMTQEVRDLWALCAEQEYRTLTSMFEVMVRDYAKKLDIQISQEMAKVPPSAKATKTTKTKK